ncbi:hypothetical protein JCM1840_004765 [Sporobolomyces johnsonii]
MFLIPTLGSFDEGEVLKGFRLLVDTGKVFNLVVQHVLADEPVFAQAVNDAFHYGKLAGLLDDYAKHAGEAAFQPFSCPSSTAQQNTVALFTASLIAIATTSPSRPPTSFLPSRLLRALARVPERSAAYGGGACACQLISTRVPGASSSGSLWSEAELTLAMHSCRKDQSVRSEPSGDAMVGKAATGEGQAVRHIAPLSLFQHIPRQLTLSELRELHPTHGATKPGQRRAVGVQSGAFLPSLVPLAPVLPAH